MSSYDDWKTDPDYGKSHRQLEAEERLADAERRVDHLEMINQLLLEAAQTLLLWIEREREGPLYPFGVKRDDPDGKRIWEAWWSDQLRLCALTEDQCRDAIAKATGVAP